MACDIVGVSIFFLLDFSWAVALCQVNIERSLAHSGLGTAMPNRLQKTLRATIADEWFLRTFLHWPLCMQHPQNGDIRTDVIPLGVTYRTKPRRPCSQMNLTSSIRVGPLGFPPALNFGERRFRS